MNIGEEPTFTELMAEYNLEDCESMLEYINTDIENLSKRSDKMLEMSAAMRSLSVEEYLKKSYKFLNDRKELLHKRIKELT